MVSLRATSAVARHAPFAAAGTLRAGMDCSGALACQAQRKRTTARQYGRRRWDVQIDAEHGSCHGPCSLAGSRRTRPGTPIIINQQITGSQRPGSQRPGSQRPGSQRPAPRILARHVLRGHEFRAPSAPKPTR